MVGGSHFVQAGWSPSIVQVLVQMPLKTNAAAPHVPPDYGAVTEGQMCVCVCVCVWKDLFGSVVPLDHPH